MNLRSASLLLAILSLETTASAQVGRVYRLAYEAPANCPDRTAFSVAVRANSARIRHALAGESAVSVEADVSHMGSSFIGVLEIRHPDGTRTTRTVEGASCTEAVEAMALIVTLTLDPDAEQPEPPAPEPAEDTASRTSESPTQKPDDPPASAGDPPASTGTLPEAFVEEDASVDESPGRARKDASPHTWQLRPGAGIGVVYGNGPGVSPEYNASLGYAPHSGYLAPLATLSAHFADSPREGTRFTRWSGRLAACPAAAATDSVALRPCLFVGFGLFREAYGNASATAPWLELGGKFRGEATVLGPVILGAEVGSALLLMGDTRGIPGGVSDDGPALGAFAAVDVGLRIW